MVVRVRQFDNDHVLSGQRSRLYSNTGILRDTAIVEYHLQSHHIACIEAEAASAKVPSISFDTQARTQTLEPAGP